MWLTLPGPRILILHPRICNPYPELVLLASFVQRVPSYACAAICFAIEAHRMCTIGDFQLWSRSGLCQKKCNMQLAGLAEQRIFCALWKILVGIIKIKDRLSHVIKQEASYNNWRWKLLIATDRASSHSQVFNAQKLNWRCSPMINSYLGHTNTRLTPGTKRMTDQELLEARGTTHHSYQNSRGTPRVLSMLKTSDKCTKGCILPVTHLRSNTFALDSSSHIRPVSSKVSDANWFGVHTTYVCH